MILSRLLPAGSLLRHMRCGLVVCWNRPSLQPQLLQVSGGPVLRGPGSPPDQGGEGQTVPPEKILLCPEMWAAGRRGGPLPDSRPPRPGGPGGLRGSWGGGEQAVHCYRGVERSRECRARGSTRGTCAWRDHGPTHCLCFCEARFLEIGVVPDGQKKNCTIKRTKYRGLPLGWSRDAVTLPGGRRPASSQGHPLGTAGSCWPQPLPAQSSGGPVGSTVTKPRRRRPTTYLICSVCLSFRVSVSGSWVSALLCPLVIAAGGFPSEVGPDLPDQTAGGRGTRK